MGWQKSLFGSFQKRLWEEKGVRDQSRTEGQKGKRESVLPNPRRAKKGQEEEEDQRTDWGTVWTPNLTVET